VNICIIAARLPVNSFGGMEVHASDLIEGLHKKGHKIIVISSIHPEHKDKVIIDDRLMYYFVGGNTLQSYTLYMKNSAVLFNSLRKTEKFDLLYSESDFAMGIVKYCKLDIPLVVLHHGFYMDEVKTRFYRGDVRGKLSSILFYIKFKFNKWEKELLKQATRLIVINKNNFKDFEKTYPFLKDRIRLVYNGIDIQRFSICSAERLRTELNIKTENVLLFTGRIDKEKGIHILIEIFPIIAETHPDVVLLITGDGAMKNILMEKVAMDKLSDKILFLGKVPYQRLPEYYSLSKIFVFPTLRFEGLPYNVIEALSCGCVVIASKRGGMESIIESGKNGILIDPKNKNMLVGEICKILDEPDLQREIRRNAREFAEKYLSIETMIDSTEKIFFEAIESYRSSK